MRTTDRTIQKQGFLFAVLFIVAVVSCVFSAFAAGDFDIQDKGVGYEIRINIAGADKENLNMEIDERGITVSGQTSSEMEEKAPGTYVSMKSYSSFSRTVPLPADADPARVNSAVEGDTLVVRIQKRGR